PSGEWLGTLLWKTRQNSPCGTLQSAGRICPISGCVTRKEYQRMTTNAPKRQTPELQSSVIQWLLDSDPSIRWQVMQDLIGAPADEVAAERKRIATEGAGARLLALQGTDGRWDGAAWNRDWNSTMHVLLLLRDMGLDPSSDQARRAVGLVRDRVTWRGCGPQEC